MPVLDAAVRMATMPVRFASALHRAVEPLSGPATRLPVGRRRTALEA